VRYVRHYTPVSLTVNTRKGPVWHTHAEHLPCSCLAKGADASSVIWVTMRRPSCTKRMEHNFGDRWRMKTRDEEWLNLAEYDRRTCVCVM
jgi:hypothetical protein